MISNPNPNLGYTTQNGCYSKSSVVNSLSVMSTIAIPFFPASNSLEEMDLFLSYCNNHFDFNFKNVLIAINEFPKVKKIKEKVLVN